MFASCGVGGIFGSIVAILLTDTVNPRSTFMFYSFAALIPIILISFVDEVKVERRT